MAEGICAALDMPRAERRERWLAAQAALDGTSPEKWGQEFLRALTAPALEAVPVAGFA